jgi:hypothetical protein
MSDMVALIGNYAEDELNYLCYSLLLDWWVKSYLFSVIMFIFIGGLKLWKKSYCEYSNRKHPVSKLQELYIAMHWAHDVYLLVPDQGDNRTGCLLFLFRL